MVARIALPILTLSSLVGCLPRPAAQPGGSYEAGPILGSRSPVLTHEFLIRNETGRDVEILGESHSCTCSRVSLSLGDLKAGETRRLGLAVDIPRTSARLAILVYVRTDHPKFPIWTYQLRLEALADARIVPDRIELPEDWHAADDPVEAWLETCEDPASPIGAITGVSAPPEVLANVAREPRVESLRNSLIRSRYRVELRPGRPFLDAGAQVSTLGITTASGRNASALLTWHRPSPLDFSTTAVHFGTFSPDQGSITRELIVRSPSGIPFAIESITDDAKLVTLDPPKSGVPDATHTLSLRLDPSACPADSGYVGGRLIIKTSHPDAHEVAVKWSAYVRDRTTVESSPEQPMPSDEFPP